MSHSRMAVRTTQRPEVSGRRERRAGTREPFCALFAAAALALLLPLLSVAPLAAAPAGKPPAPAPAAPAPDTPQITLSAAEVPAVDLQESLLSVDRFGRYSVKVENAQGSSLELIDHMAGSLGKAGEAGRENGRLDLFLDRGRYKLWIQSGEKGSGKAKILARSFRERRGGPGAAAPRLVETRLVEESLDDLEQVSYWLEIGQRRGVRLEAAGRNLADLRLWRDGAWLEGVEPKCQAIQPVLGQPLLRCRLASVLEPGLYLLTAYGGIAQPWAEGSEEHPFYLRWGEPRLPATGRRRYVVSPFGEDHFLLPESVNFFRLELSEARPAGLAAGWVRGGSLYEQATDASSAAITKESLPPAAEVHTQSKPADSRTEPEAPASEASSDAADAPEESEGAEMTPPEEGSGEEPAVTEEAPAEGEGEMADSTPPQRTQSRAAAAPAVPATGPLPWELVATVTGAPGHPYILQHFEQRDGYKIQEGGTHWLSSVHAGAAEDSVDATALVTDTPPDKPRRFLTGAAIPLDGNSSWTRRFNLIEELNLFLEVKETGRYKAMTNGAAARARIEPFFLSRPEHYESPVFQGANSSWDLDAGFYVLTLEPERKGIVTLTLRPAGKTGMDLPVQVQPVQGAVRFAPIELDPSHVYDLYFNHQPGVTAGLVLRPWPLDLDDPLPVAQKPGEAFEIPFHAGQAGTLRAEAEDGLKLEVSLDGAPWVAEAAVAPGNHKVGVRHDRPGTVSYSLWVEPAILQASTPLPPLPDAALAALPKLPVLAAGSPRFLDLERGQRATYLLRADKPGLYAVRSTGLLATAGTVRTRTVPLLRRDEQNGVGRNFLVQQYLREGDYQVTVEALGPSSGHAGMALETTQILDGGELRPGMPGHFSLPAGQAAVFRVVIPAAGDYTLRALGLGFKFLCRFEDAAGWPWEKPSIPADLNETLEPGTYRFVLLPQPVDTRALVLLEKKPEKLVFKGHGPHSLPLEQQVEHIWMEPASSDQPSERPSDVWRFEVPAKVHARVELTDEMQGHLTHVEGGEGVGFVPPGRSWSGELEPGHYQLAAECSRRNSRVRYKVVVHTDELVAGLERKVTAPAELRMAVGKDSLIELTSIAPADVRARLYDAEDRQIAESDDRPDDWNFLLFQRLAPGLYTLKVEPVGTKSTEVRVAMRAPAEVEQAALPLPFHGNVQLGSDVLLRPLTPDPKADLLLVAARSKDSLGLSVEVRDGTAWRTVGTSIAHDAHLEIPLVQSAGSPAQAGYRLRVWSLDRHDTPVRLAAAALTSPRLGEQDLRRGTTLPAVAGFEPALGAAVVELDRPGVFRLAEPAPGLRGSGIAGTPLSLVGMPEGGVLSSPGDRFWVVREGKSRSLRAERIVVAPGLDAGAQFPVPAGAGMTAVACDLGEGDSGASGPVLALVTAPSGQPGVRVTETEEKDLPGTGEPAATTMAVGPRTAVAVDLAPRHPVARVWQAEGLPGESEGSAEEMRLAQLRFPPPAKTGQAAWGVLDGTLDGIVARQLDLPAGPRKLRLSLGEATVAVLSRGDAVVSTHWQGGAPFEEQLDDGTATRLTLLHTRAGADPFTVELLPRGAGEPPLSLAPGALLERSLDRAGTLRLSLSASDKAATLHVRGADATAVLLGRDGGVVRSLVRGLSGTDLPAGRGGVALIRHGPGLLLAWLGEAGDETAALWPAARDPRPTPVKVDPPASVPLAGRFAELALAGGGPRVLHLRMAEPAATLLHRSDGSPDEVEVHPESGRLDVFLPAGEARLGLRALAGAQLSGVAEVTVTPVTAIGEGLGPEVLLPAGGSRWFSFHVERKGPVGVGAHADSDVVEIELYDRAGKRLESHLDRGGVVRMPELAPGDYLLALRSPAGAAPVKARPALAGLALPDTGPPADVVRQYLQEAGAETPESVPGSEP